MGNSVVKGPRAGGGKEPTQVTGMWQVAWSLAERGNLAFLGTREPAHVQVLAGVGVERAWAAEAGVQGQER